MPTAEPLPVLVAGDAAAEPLTRRLTAMGVSARAIPWDVDGAASVPCAAVVVAGGSAAALNFCRHLSGRLGDHCPPLAVIADDRVGVLRAGADACLSPSIDDDELRAHCETFSRWTTSRRRLRGKADEALQFNDRLQQAYNQINLDLEFAGRLQASFLPKQLPQVGRVRFAVHYQPCGSVGGDFYDVFRLDERHVGFYLADAMGHGVPASLLTVYLKKAVTPKEITPCGYRIVPADEVLTQLNRDLLAQNLAELPFVTMVYGVVNCETGEVGVARAAHPHPVVAPATGQSQEWVMPGTLLGVFESSFKGQSRTLAAGDKLVIATDGISAESGDPESLVVAVAGLKHLPLAEFVPALADTMKAGRDLRDDFSLLAMEVGWECR